MPAFTPSPRTPEVHAFGPRNRISGRGPWVGSPRLVARLGEGGDRALWKQLQGLSAAPAERERDLPQEQVAAWVDNCTDLAKFELRLGGEVPRAVAPHGAAGEALLLGRENLFVPSYSGSESKPQGPRDLLVLVASKGAWQRRVHAEAHALAVALAPPDRYTGHPGLDYVLAWQGSTPVALLPTLPEVSWQPGPNDKMVPTPHLHDACDSRQSLQGAHLERLLPRGATELRGTYCGRAGGVVLACNAELDERGGLHACVQQGVPWRQSVGSLDRMLPWETLEAELRARTGHVPKMAQMHLKSVRGYDLDWMDLARLVTHHGPARLWGNHLPGSIWWLVAEARSAYVVVNQTLFGKGKDGQVRLPLVAFLGWYAAMTGARPVLRGADFEDFSLRFSADPTEAKVASLPKVPAGRAAALRSPLTRVLLLSSSLGEVNVRRALAYLDAEQLAYEYAKTAGPGSFFLGRDRGGELLGVFEVPRGGSTLLVHTSAPSWSRRTNLELLRLDEAPVPWPVWARAWTEAHGRTPRLGHGKMLGYVAPVAAPEGAELDVSARYELLSRRGFLGRDDVHTLWDSERREVLAGGSLDLLEVETRAATLNRLEALAHYVGA